MTGLTTGAGQEPEQDLGAPDPTLAAALTGWESDPTPEAEAAVHAALVGTRLLVPLVPLPATEGDEPGTREMARPTLIGSDGRPAVPAFTSVASLTAWRPDARPVPASGREVLTAAHEAGQAVLVDLAGPVAYVVQGAALDRLATGVIRLPDGDAVAAEIAGRPVEGGLSRVDQGKPASATLRAALAGALAVEPLVTEAYLLAPEVGPDASDLAVGLVLADEVTPTTLVGVVRRLADGLGDALGGHHGLDIAVLTPAQREAAAALGPAVYAAPVPPR